MQADNFLLPAYCQRIGYTAPLTADIATIASLMKQQVFSIPFENLDVQAGNTVSMTPEKIVDKILYHYRGGYCYELNGIFAMVLAAMDIPYYFVAARPMFYPARRPRTHMVIVATIDGQDYLCDLGFGNYGIREPIALSSTKSANTEQEILQDGNRYKIERDERGFYTLSAYVDDLWQAQYAFDEYPQEWIDFIPANHFNSTHPDALFVRKLLVLQHTKTGRNLLLDDTLKTSHNGETTTRTVSKEEIESVLWDVFALADKPIR